MIGKVIRSLLDDNANLVALVPVAKMFPYVSNPDTERPFIVYTIDSLETKYNKDGQVHYNYTFSVVSISEDYANLQSIVEQVRVALESKRGTVEGITIEPIYLRGWKEAYSISDNAYANSLTFDVNVI